MYPSCIAKPTDAAYVNTSRSVHAAIGFQSTPPAPSRAFTFEVGVLLRWGDSARRTPHAEMTACPGNRLRSAEAIGADFSSLVQNRMAGVDQGRIIRTHDSSM